jgi:UDP-glucose 4-epimerase
MPPISIVILHGVTTHVRDVIHGLVLTAEHELTGEVNSFNTVVEMLNDELGTDIDPAYVENPIPEDVYVHDTCADPSQMCEKPGWEPRISFEEGVRRVCAAYQ